MATKKAEVVTLEDLTAALDKAFAVASARHDVSVAPGTYRLGWEIVGRRLRDKVVGKSGPLEIASTVAGAAKLGAVNPIAVQLKGGIFVGFWDPEVARNLPSLTR